MRECSQDEIVAAVDSEIAALLAAGCCAAPPVDVIRLARSPLGIEPQPGRPRQAGHEPRNMLRTGSALEQRQWNAALAIGQHLKPALLRRLGMDPENVARLHGVSLPNLFAHRLLVPRTWLENVARAVGYDLAAFKERFATASYENVALRLLDLPDPCVITILDNGHVTHRRSNAWQVNRQLLPPERECQEYVNYYSRPKRVVSDNWTVAGWPVHELDWKREVLRSVCEE
jgi:hypothetical protein